LKGSLDQFTALRPMQRKTATGDRRYDERKKAGQVSLPGFFD
jgi:hypothetical protein